jgi:hypothetical protein
MRRVKKALRVMVVALGVFGAQTAHAIPAAADPSDFSCPLKLFFVCRMVPVAPDLDHDIDLTKEPPPWASAVPPADSTPAGDVCVDGCS